jgi:hypothetical protein
MPTHFVFSFGVGDYFRFKFDYGKKPSSVPFDPKSAITAWEMAKVREHFHMVDGS